MSLRKPAPSSIAFPWHELEMLEELGPLLRNLPPITAGAFAQAINICSRELGLGPEWVRRWIAFTVIADALTSYAPGGKLIFELKGGAAIEMRLRLLTRGAAQQSPTPPPRDMVHPRATRDLDATFRGTMNDLEDEVRAALSQPRHGFSFRTVFEPLRVPVVRRIDVHVRYQQVRFGRVQDEPFSRIQLEVSIYEGVHRDPEMVPAFSLKPFGIEGPETLPCLPLAKQIAQKVHAVTAQPEDRPNDRFRDLIDIALVSTLVEPSPELRDACEETFRIRGQHTWPPRIVAHPHWIAPMERHARELGLPQETAAEIVQYVARFVASIAAAE